MNSSLHTLGFRLYTYQKERFPVVVLALSFIPAILSSGAITSSSVTPAFVFSALLVSLAYLLHVRIIDEFRDAAHDALHHKDRPVPRGAISLGELRTVDSLALCTLGVTALLSSVEAFFIVCGMIVYSLFARSDFFMGMKFREHFFLYNAVNLVQMVLLQILVYTISTGAFLVTELLLLHLCFTTGGTIVFEFLRKVKLPGDDGTGKDTYTWYLGFTPSLSVFGLLSLVTFSLFVLIMPLGEDLGAVSGAALACLAFSLLGTFFWNAVQRSVHSHTFMQLSFMSMYSYCHILIFLSL